MPQSTSIRPRLVTQRGLKAEYGVDYSNGHLLRLEAQGRFPRRVKIGGGRTAWFAHEIEAWLRSLGTIRDQGDVKGDGSATHAT